jgi:hypothetical protein
MRIINFSGDEYQRYSCRMKLVLQTKESVMNYQVMPETEVVIQRIRSKRINPVYRFPSVSIFMPFDPKMGMKNKLTSSLSKANDKVVSELNNKYPGEMSLLVIQKLKTIIKNLNFNTHKKSLAIFVSPVFEKVYYLNMDVEEKVIVNESLQIRELVYSKKQSQQFHILLLKEKGSRIFLGASNSFVRILPESPVSENTSQLDSPDQISNFPDSVAKEMLMKGFLHRVDYSLDIILKYSRLPVFVMGTEELFTQFKNITRHGEAIIECMPGDYEESSLEYLRKILHLCIVDWQKIKQKYLLSQLEEAANKNMLVAGMSNVWQEIMNHKGQMLLIEKRYLYDTVQEEKDGLNYEMPGWYNKFSCIKNSIDELIEKILENGGNVELVSNGFLQEYGQIALIKNDDN